MSTAPIVFADTETTELDRGRRLAWDVALIRRDPDMSIDRSIQFYIDVPLHDANPFALRVGKFYDRHPYGRWLSNQANHLQTPRDLGEYLTPSAAAETIARWTYGAHIIGAIPSFDAETFSDLLLDNHLTPAWHHHIIDVEAMAVGWLQAKRPGHPALALPYKSDDLALAVAAVIGEETGTAPDLTIPEDERHTAMGDTKWARTWYDAMMNPVGA